MRRSYSAAGTFSLSLSRLYIENPPGDIHRWRRTNLVVTGLWLLAFVQSPGIDGVAVAVAAGKAAGCAVDHADIVNGETGDRLAERDRHRDRRVEPHLSAWACGGRDVGAAPCPTPYSPKRCRCSPSWPMRRQGRLRARQEPEAGKSLSDSLPFNLPVHQTAWHFSRPLQELEKATEMEMGVADRNRMLARMVAAAPLARNQYVGVPRMIGACQAVAYSEGGESRTLETGPEPVPHQRRGTALRGYPSREQITRFVSAWFITKVDALTRYPM